MVFVLYPELVSKVNCERCNHSSLTDFGTSAYDRYEPFNSANEYSERGHVEQS